MRVLNMLIDLSEACEFIRNCNDAVILTHQSPDGDCIGSGLALQDILKSLGKKEAVSSAATNFRKDTIS